MYLTLAITGLSMVQTLMTYLYGGACPWTAESEDQISFFASGQELVNTISQPLIIFVVIAVAYGFDVIFADVTSHALKLVFSMTFARFLTTKLQ